MKNKIKIFWYWIRGFKIILKHEHYKRCRSCKKYRPLTIKWYKRHGKSKFRHNCRRCEWVYTLKKLWKETTSNHKELNNNLDRAEIYFGETTYNKLKKDIKAEQINELNK